MKLVVLANEQQKEELLSAGFNDNCKIIWINSSNEFSSHPDADAILDLLFEENNYDVSHLKSFLQKTVIINSVSKTISEIGLPFIRINAWPGFLKREITEAACGSGSNKKEVERILSSFNKKTEWTPDIKGFISARVVSMIINEAWFTLEEKVSTKEDIDIAMKLGTNYPYGPFEWGKKIGLKNIAGLLSELSLLEKRYEPATLLIKEAAK
jgi:3-hydroxybutyryl-CoA dehydrogenase